MPQNTYFFSPFFFFALCILVTGYNWFVLKNDNDKQQKSPFIFFNNCISAQVIHYSLKPCLCNLTSEMLAIKACTCNNDKETAFYITINKMCMNVKPSHPFTESAEGTHVHSHHGVLSVPALQHMAYSLWQAVFQGPLQELRSGAHFCRQNLGGSVHKSDERGESSQRTNAIFWLPWMRLPAKKPEHSFLLKTNHQFVIRLFQLYRVPCYQLEQKE